MTFSVTADLVVLLELDSVWQGSVQGSVYQLAATVSLSLPENIQVFHAILRFKSGYTVLALDQAQIRCWKVRLLTLSSSILQKSCLKAI